MIAGGRVPAGEAGPMHVHQGDEVPRVLSGQNLIRCRVGGAPPVSCVGTSARQSRTSLSGRLRLDGKPASCPHSFGALLTQTRG
jgi:hypothetical protein